QISDIIAAVDWLTANRVNPAVANISITAPGTSPAMESAITNSISAGITYTIAAGNSGWLACDYTPARTVNAITVGATSDTDFRPNYSNYGACVDIFAPGHNVLSANHANDTATASKSGTSQAAPLVAGIAAVYRAANPSASPATVAQALLSTATTGTVTNLGDGSPNKLIYSWLSGGPSPTPSPTATPTPTPTPVPSSGQLRIRKRTVRSGGGPASTASFPYAATNIPTTNFVLVDNQEFSDPNVQGSSQVIAVTEDSVQGWRLASIECVETAGSGPNVSNTTVDLTNRRANILVEPGEIVDCTFTSEELVPTAANITISGRVSDDRGRGIKGIRLSLQNAATGEVLYISTNSFGLYSFSEVPVGTFYIVTAFETKKWSIPNNTRTFIAEEDLVGIDFTVESP
ncbi:MAG TPA: S8 family serine peptidase, partial [Pyrinomonadaceae bacterium]|nr:S8 family serine peptidase [Pyrinomonadaceae bacterium]